MSSKLLQRQLNQTLNSANGKDQKKFDKSSGETKPAKRARVDRSSALAEEPDKDSKKLQYFANLQKSKFSKKAAQAMQKVYTPLLSKFSKRS